MCRLLLWVFCHHRSARAKPVDHRRLFLRCTSRRTPSVGHASLESLRASSVLRWRTSTAGTTTRTPRGSVRPRHRTQAPSDSAAPGSMLTSKKSLHALWCWRRRQPGGAASSVSHLHPSKTIFVHAADVTNGAVRRSTAVPVHWLPRHGSLACTAAVGQPRDQTQGRRGKERAPADAQHRSRSCPGDAILSEMHDLQAGQGPLCRSIRACTDPPSADERTAPATTAR